MVSQDSFRHTQRASRQTTTEVRQRDRKRRLSRRSLLETLENRHLLAVGPTLVGIEPNNGTLFNLSGVTALAQSPTELTLRFVDTQRLDENTLGAIRIVRSGDDGFATARGATDFNTNGLATIEFIGTSSSETRVAITATDRGSVSAAPVVTAVGNTVNIALNSNATAPTRVSDLLTAINTGSSANLVTATLIQGVNFAPISNNIGSGINFTLVAADRAQATSNLAASNVRVRFAARQTGQAGQAIKVNVLYDNSVGVAPNVALVGSEITVRINPASNVTVKQFVDALNARPTVAELLETRLEAGDPNSLVGNPGLFSPILLQNGQSIGGVQADDVIRPGFIGLGDLPGEVVIRFAEPLVQDTYRVEISAEGDSALTNVLGQPVNMGQDFAATFNLNLAPLVQAVVPQPVINDSLGRRQLLNEVWVYFNRNDPLDKVGLENNPGLFRMYSNTGDQLTPIVTYNPDSGVARLRFAENLQPAGATVKTWRLRVGADAAEPVTPITLTVPNENDLVVPRSAIPGDSFATALDVSANWSPSNTRVSSIALTSEIRNGLANTFELDFPGGSDEPGNRQLRPEDPTRLDRPVPLDHLNKDADAVNGVSKIDYNFFGSFAGDESTVRGLDLDKTYPNLITETQKQRVREVLDLYSQYLGVQFVESPTLGFQIAVGDLYGADPRSTSGTGGLAVAKGVRISPSTGSFEPRPLGVLDFRDFEQSNDDQVGDEFFRGAMFMVGQLLLGYGYANELPLAINSGDSIFINEPEALFPGPADIVHGQYLFRPDSVDVDLYKFTVPAGGGKITIETIAERLGSTSLLDTQLRLFQRNPSGEFLEIAANDDYWSSDSQIEVTLAGGTYYAGVSASGNAAYDPITSGTGIGGRSDGAYELRIALSPTQAVAIRDATGVELDGDADGVAGGNYDFWFDAASAARTVFVDKQAAAGGDGSIARPLNTISAAITRANGGAVDVIRIMANGGADGRLETDDDNLPYLVGFGENGQQLADGADFQVPKGVTVMVDAGAVIKLRRARIGVGSASPSPLQDRSGGAVQILGTPLLVTSNGARVAGDVVTGEVVLTSLADFTVGGSQSASAALPGDWGGIDFRSDIDKADAARENQEAQGIFLNNVQWADIRYGGGVIVVNSRSTSISPVEMSHSRPTVAYSTIALSADSALEATPDSFEDSKYFLPGREHQAVGDYDRVGPDFRGNRFINEALAKDLNINADKTINSLNGVFIRTETLDGTGLERLNLQARFDDSDIVHVLGENLSISGTPGGPVSDQSIPASQLINVAQLVSITPQEVGTIPTGLYQYRLTFVDAAGNESPASEPTRTVLVSGPGTVQLKNLPALPSGSAFVAKNLYRSVLDADARPTDSYQLVAKLAGEVTFLDRGQSTGQTLTPITPTMRARLDARLVVDPGVTLKSAGSVVELGIGTQLIAEGTPGQTIVMTSLDDRRYGGGGTFNTSAAASTQGFTRADRTSDWGGIYVGLGANASLDYVRMIGAGGASRIQGVLAGFNPIEVRQGTLRLTNSRIEDAGDAGNGLGGDRLGRGQNEPAAVFVRGAQPIVIGNVFIGNEGPALNFDVNSLNNDFVSDTGRSTGRLERMTDSLDNQGPLVRNNTLQNNTLNGLQIRGGVLATEGAWDDTDIVHIVMESIEVPNQHVFGGLRLESSPTQSLVVKFRDTSDSNGIISAAGIVAGGTLTSASAQMQDIADRIGGSLQIIGQSGKPVVLTALSDDSIGAGFDLLGQVVADTANDGFGANTFLPTGPEVTNGLFIDNDVALNTVGYFGVEPANGGSLSFAGRGGVTVQGVTLTTPLIDQNFIFAFLNFVDVGANGGAISLAATTITTPATLIDDDLVISEGTFAGANGPVRWRVETRLDDGVSRVINTLSFASDTPFGDIRYVNYLDEDVFGITDDLLFTTGIPGQDNFRVYTLDGVERIGFSQSGAFLPGPDLQNASYQGWAADRFNLLQTAITGPGANFTVQGNINLANLPALNDPALGAVNGPGDITTAFAWDINPASTTSRITTFLELVPQDPTSIPSGEWEGITIREAANDNNYKIAVEGEGGGVGIGSFNDSVNFAQFLGDLAPNEKFATENRSKGFRVSGTISKPSDVDYYSFKAEAGTEVWFDIDQSASSLDAVLELVEDGYVSDTSNLEVGVRSLAVSHVDLSAFGKAQDLFSTNPKDPGFRAVLPGDTGQVFTYRIRVGSKDNLTKGPYQLEIRVTDLDQSPGTYLHLANVRFARTGINVIGQPLHSPLIGEEGETALPNDVITAAQRLGQYGVAEDGTVITVDAGPLSSDRLSKTISGTLSGAGDVDWYQFELQYNNLTRDGLGQYLSTIFDADYSDGFSRPDISIWVFDAAGNLVLSGLDSNIGDDRFTKSDTSGLTDLSEGSGGSLDPYVGSVEMREGTYFLAVGGRDFVPAEFNQFYVANPVNPLFRLEPIESIQRIVEDRIGGATTSTVAPKQSLLFNPGTMATPYTLNDIALYVSSGNGTISIVNPFSGQNYGSVGSASPTNVFLRDIAFRSNGDLHAYRTNGIGDNALDYLLIDSGTAAATDLTPLGTGLVTHGVLRNAQGVLVDAFTDDGLTVEAITFGNVGGGERGFFIGNRQFSNQFLEYSSNILVEFNPATGRLIGPSGFSRPFFSFGAGLDPQEIAQIETIPPVTQRQQNILGTSDATTFSSNGQPVASIQNGDTFNVLDAVGNILGTFVFSSGPEVRFSSLFVEAGQTRATNGSNVQLTGGSSPTNDFYNGLFLQIGNEIRKIIDYDGQSQTVAVDAPFNVLPPLGSPYQILSDRFVRDADTLTVTQAGQPTVRLEFETGPRLRIDASVRDGTLVTLSGGFGTKTFEFDSNSLPTTPTNLLVTLNNVTSPAAALASAINNASIGVVANAVGSEVVLFGLNSAPVATTGVTVVGANGVAPGNIAVKVEESMGASEIAREVRRVLALNGVTAQISGTRLNIPSALSAISTGNGMTTLPSPASLNPIISFNVNDTATQIRDSIIAAINLSGIVTATILDADSLRIPANFAVVNSAGLRVGGTAPNTTTGFVPAVTGIATINNTLYAVTDAGGLFRVSNAELGRYGNFVLQASTHYVNTATDLVGINFAGLSQGPAGFGDYLFGIDQDGVMYAFDETGDLQPIFAGGRSSIATGVSGATGLDFSTLQSNLWGTANDGRLGHGSNQTFNGSRSASGGSTALRFGPYNFPGGAHGEITSEPFSLSGFGGADQPILYFNYFLETENSAAPADVLRVYVIGQDGIEHAVSTSFATLGGGLGDDEFDDPAQLGGIFSRTYNDNSDRRHAADTQPLFDNSNSWRQVRIPLNVFAGEDGLRMRIEFSTSGNLSAWDSQLTAVPATQIRDGDVFTISGRTFEFEKALTITLPPDQVAAVGIPPRSSGQILQAAGVQIIQVDGVTYALAARGTVPPPVADILVEFDPALNSTAIARLLADAIANSDRMPAVTDPNDTNERTSDTLNTAVVLPIIGERTEVVLPGRNIGGPADAVALDVDLYRLDVVEGHTIEVIVEAETLGFVPVLRLFDELGAPLNFVLDNLGVGSVRLTFTSTLTGPIFIGVSGGAGPNAAIVPGNTTYSPTDPTTAVAGTRGTYRIELIAMRNSNVRSQANEVAVNRDAIATVVSGTAVTLTGDNGTAGIPVSFNVAMTAEDIAKAVSEVLRATFVVSNRVSAQILGAVGANIKLQGATVNNSGPLKQLGRSGDAFGVGVVQGARRNTGFEGVWLDDFIIGFAERGEIGSGASGVTTFTASGRPANNSPAINPLTINTGAYQIEIRDGSEYLFSNQYSEAIAPPSGTPIGRGFDTNDRLESSVTLITASGRLINQLITAATGPLTFSISDGKRSATFQFIDLETLPPGTLAANAFQFVASGNIAVPYTGGFTASEVASNLLSAIKQSSLDVRPAISSGASPGDARINLIGENITVESNIVNLVTSLENLLVTADRHLISSTDMNLDGLQTISASELVDSLNGLGNALFLPQFGIAVAISTGRGDANRNRDSQGVILIDGVNVQFSTDFGVRLDHGLGDAASPNVVRYPRNLIELNTLNLVPGVVVQNSILAFNGGGGIEVVGVGADPSQAPPLSFDRLVNNTIIGGRVSEGPTSTPVRLDGTLFPMGEVAFADAVIAYSPSLGGVPPALDFRNSQSALGLPDYIQPGEPTAAGQGAVSLGRRGTLVVQFVNNRLTGSGDAAPDLKVFEVGITESVRVELSIDGLTYTDVGIVQGGQNTVDIDAFGFGPADRISYVRLTDVGFSVTGDLASGADIDAIGAITSVPADVFSAAGIGIRLASNVSPTILNNVLVNNATGLLADATSTTAVVAGNTYQRNATAVSGPISNERLRQDIGVLEDLFVSLTTERFIPNRNSAIIDNAIDSLQDRAQLAVVKQPIGLPESPVLSPDLDGNGTPRVDDPSVDVPGGVGQSLFKDRGALDRGDNAPPRAIVASPLDQGVADRNRAIDKVTVIAATTRFFDIRLADGGEPIYPNGGVGIDDTSVKPDVLLLTKNGIPQIRDTDYRFAYDVNTDTIRLVPTAGLWEIDSLYEISLVTDNQAVLIALTGSGYTDGDRFLIVDQTSTTNTFEIDTGIVIEVADNGAGRSAVLDGDQVTIFDGTNELIFEFELVNALGVGSGFGLNNIPVIVQANATRAEAGAALAAAIDSTPLNLVVVNLEDGRVQLLSANRNVTATSDSAQLTITGATGVEPGYGILIPGLLGIASTIADGQQFSIRRGDGREVVFEFTTDATVTLNSVPVAIAINASVIAVANAINAAIRTTNLDLLPVVDPAGIVLLPNAADASILVGTSPLLQIGRSGQIASIRVPMPLNLSVVEVAQLLESTIDSLALPGVSTARIGDRLVISGTVSGTGAALVSPASDLAGNRLVGNDASGFALFQIQLTNTSGTDFGDAPGSQKANDGPSHQIVEAFSLGLTVDSEADALIATGDNSDDGITFRNSTGQVFSNGGSILAGFPVDIMANVINGQIGRSAFIDAWIDWDGDGVFETSGAAGPERIASKVAVQPGDNSLGSILVPAGAARGNIAARFRLSTTGNLSPTGAAADGEVEDYSLFVSSNPFQNGSNRFDVNGDGDITPVDALMVINALNSTPPEHLAPGGSGFGAFSLILNSAALIRPPYWDVDGNGQVTPLDALLLINRLNDIVAGRGEEDGLLPAATGVLAPAAQVRRDTFVPPVDRTLAEAELDEALHDVVAEAVFGPSVAHEFLATASTSRDSDEEESEDSVWDSYFIDLSLDS